MEKIQIKCTSCGQKFAVSESYRGKMVECGACDHRFKVEGSAILRTKRRLYPGEKSALKADDFSKTPSQATSEDGSKRGPSGKIAFEPANYNQHVSSDYATPGKPRKTVAVAIGVSLIILVILVFLLGGRSNGALQDISDTKRLLLAVFITILGGSLIVYGSRRKGRGLVAAVILGGLLISMPFIFPETLTPQRDVNTAELSLNNDSEGTEIGVEDAEAIYREGIGYKDVVRLRREAAQQEKNPGSVKAVVLKNVGSYIDTIQFYMKSKLALSVVPSTYTLGREINNQPVTLMIFESDKSIEEVLEITKRFGEPSPMDGMLADLGIIEVAVDSRQFISQNAQTLSNENDAEYFAANFVELNSMNRSKQLETIKRLNRTQTSLGRRSDISDRLASLITENDKLISTEAIKTLNKWTLPEYELNGIVFDYAKKLSASETLDPAVMDYLVDQNVKDSHLILAEQWLRPEGYLRWEDQLVRAGAEGEQAMIKALPIAPDTHIKSGAAILRKIGTSKSIPMLRSTASKLNEENANYLKASIDEIQSRQ